MPPRKRTEQSEPETAPTVHEGEGVPEPPAELLTTDNARKITDTVWGGVPERITEIDETVDTTEIHASDAAAFDDTAPAVGDGCFVIDGDARWPAVITHIYPSSPGPESYVLLDVTAFPRGVAPLPLVQLAGFLTEGEALANLGEAPAAFGHVAYRLRPGE